MINYWWCTFLLLDMINRLVTQSVQADSLIWTSFSSLPFLVALIFEVWLSCKSKKKKKKILYIKWETCAIYLIYIYIYIINLWHWLQWYILSRWEPPKDQVYIKYKPKSGKLSAYNKMNFSTTLRFSKCTFYLITHLRKFVIKKLCFKHCVHFHSKNLVPSH